MRYSFVKVGSPEDKVDNFIRYIYYNSVFCDTQSIDYVKKISAKRNFKTVYVEDSINDDIITFLKTLNIFDNGLFFCNDATFKIACEYLSKNEEYFFTAETIIV